MFVILYHSYDIMGVSMGLQGRTFWNCLIMRLKASIRWKQFVNILNVFKLVQTYFYTLLTTVDHIFKYIDDQFKSVVNMSVFAITHYLTQC